MFWKLWKIVPNDLISDVAEHRWLVVHWRGNGSGVLQEFFRGAGLQWNSAAGDQGQ